MNRHRSDSGRARTIAVTIGLAVSAASAGAAASPALATVAELDQLTLAVADAELPAVPNAIGTLAATQRYYEARGLQVDVVRLQGTPQVIAALRSGEADVGNIGTSDLITVDAQDVLDLVAINSSQSDLSFLIAATTSITTPSELEGKTYAISREGGLDATMARLVLDGLGVDLDAVEFVAVGDPAARAQAIANGVVDAGTMSVGTYQSIADVPDVAVLVDPGVFLETAPIVQKVNAATAEVAAESPEVLTKFVLAQMDIARDYAADPAAWAAAVAAERPDLEEESLASITDLFAGSWCVNGCLNADALEATSEFLYTTEDLAEVPEIGLDEWVDQTFVEAALEELGVWEDEAVDPR